MTSLHHGPDKYKNQEMRIKEVVKYSWDPFYAPDQFNTHRICDDAVRSEESYPLQYVPDWFATQEQVKIWYNYSDYCSDNETAEFYDDHKNTRCKKPK